MTGYAVTVSLNESHHPSLVGGPWPRSELRLSCAGLNYGRAHRPICSVICIHLACMRVVGKKYTSLFLPTSCALRRALRPKRARLPNKSKTRTRHLTAVERPWPKPRSFSAKFEQRQHLPIWYPG
jgi:hypothetical protein